MFSNLDRMVGFPEMDMSSFLTRVAGASNTGLCVSQPSDAGFLLKRREWGVDLRDGREGGGENEWDSSSTVVRRMRVGRTSMVDDGRRGKVLMWVGLGTLKRKRGYGVNKRGRETSLET